MCTFGFRVPENRLCTHRRPYQTEFLYFILRYSEASLHVEKRCKSHVKESPEEVDFEEH